MPKGGPLLASTKEMTLVNGGIPAPVGAFL
jgi:hypothetical protein